MKNFFFLFVFYSFVANAQTGVGVNTVNPRHPFHVDGASDNAVTGNPTTLQAANDFNVTTAGNVGIGTNAPAHKLHVAGNSRTDGYTLVGNPIAPNIPAGKDVIYEDDFEGDVFWSLDNGYGCGSTSTWYYALLTSGDLFTTSLAFAPSASRSRRRMQSPSIWIPSYFNNFYISLNSRTIGTFDEPEDGVWLEWKDEGSNGAGTTWAKVTSFVYGGYGNITSGSNLACSANNAQSGWHMNDKGTDYGDIYDQTANITSVGRYIRIGLVGVEDNSASDEIFHLYDVVVYGNRPALSTSFNAGSLYSEGPIYASVQYRLGDLAEYFKVDNFTKPGDLIAINPNKADSYTLANNDQPHLLLGIHSENPTVTLNSPEEGTPVALTGRVYVNVTNENGSIKIGDYLTVSSVVGKATKAITSGYVVGRALENFDEKTGKILCMVETGWSNINSRPTNTSGGSFNIPSNQSVVKVIDQSVNEQSRVFISFRDFANSDYKIGQIGKGYFELHLKAKNKNSIKFDYFVDQATYQTQLKGKVGEVTINDDFEIIDLASNEQLQQNSSEIVEGKTNHEKDEVEKKLSPELEAKFPSKAVSFIVAKATDENRTAPLPPDPDMVWFWTAERGFFTMNDVKKSKSKFIQVEAQKNK